MGKGMEKWVGEREDNKKRNADDGGEGSTERGRRNAACPTARVPLAGRHFGLGSFIANLKSPHSQYPVLKKAIKAAQQRWLAPVICQLSKDYEDGSDLRRMRTLCCESLCTYYDC